MCYFERLYSTRGGTGQSESTCSCKRSYLSRPVLRRSNVLQEADMDYLAVFWRTQFGIEKGAGGKGGWEREEGEESLKYS